ncbi:MAG TPA: YggT family protein [Acidimicrobiia bacterium]|nr:YggT family protein [Acidimicrobiia bacterium]
MIIDIILRLLFVFQVLLIVYALLSWFPLRPGGVPSQIYGVLDRLFNPILSFLRRYIPPIGRFDLSFLVLIMGIWLLQSLLSA